MLKGCAAVSNFVPRRKEFPTNAYLLPKTFLSMREAQFSTNNSTHSK
jgi:hypothetical protein